jgi:hypothetical protein
MDFRQRRFCTPLRGGAAIIADWLAVMTGVEYHLSIGAQGPKL